MTCYLFGLRAPPPPASANDTSFASGLCSTHAAPLLSRGHSARAGARLRFTCRPSPLPASRQAASCNDALRWVCRRQLQGDTTNPHLPRCNYALLPARGRAPHQLQVSVRRPYPLHPLHPILPRAFFPSTSNLLLHTPKRLAPPLTARGTTPGYHSWVQKRRGTQKRQFPSRTASLAFASPSATVPLLVTASVSSVEAAESATSELAQLTDSALLESEEASWKVPRISNFKRVALVRHGESTWNATGRIQGSSNFSELTAKGEAQAETSRQMLTSDKFDVCFHSPLQRSAKTAVIIWGSRDAPLQPLDDLREIDLYSFQGLLKDEGKARFGAQFRMWQVDAANFEIDGHYPVRELWGRARRCWAEVLACPAQSVLVVAHNAVNQALVATALGLGPEYFRMLLQSNCGVSVLDFAPAPASTLVCLNRLNQTPSPPVRAGGGAGRKAECRVVLVCHGMTDSIARKCYPTSPDEPLNMLGVVQSRKTSELLLDVRVDTILSSPERAALDSASAIYEVQVAADCLGADCTPRDVDVVPLEDLRDLDYGELRGTPCPQWSRVQQEQLGGSRESLESLGQRAGAAWSAIRSRLAKAEAAWENPDALSPSDGLAACANGSAPSAEGVPAPSGVVIVVTHEAVVRAMVAACLGLAASESLTFNVDEGGLTVVDFPDGAQGRGVVRCSNYTAHLGRWAVPVTQPTFFDEAF